MTPKEATIQAKLTQATALLDTAHDILKYLGFEKLRPPGVARCGQVSDHIMYVVGMLELLTADLDTGEYPFREYQVRSPDRLGSREA